MADQEPGSEGESSSPGGLSILRDIDHSGALCKPGYHTKPVDASLEHLQDWFSPARMSRYADSNQPGLFYVWNARLAKAFLEDVGHVEVLLRNFIHDRLTKDNNGNDWYHATNRYHFNRPFQASIAKVERQLAKRGRAVTSDQIIAELSFDNWRFLLTQRHEVTIWKALTDLNNGGMPNYPGRNRAIFESDVELIRQLRNRASHQEPLIIEAALTGTESQQLDAYAMALKNTATRINPDAAQWITINSRVDAIRQLRPAQFI